MQPIFPDIAYSSSVRKIGKTYTQTGSNVMTPEGDIHIAAKRVDINAAHDTSDSTQDTRFQQSGLTLQVTNPVISAIQSIQQMKQASEKTKDKRMQGLAAGAAALTVANTAMQVGGSAAPAGGIDLAISIGASTSKSHSEQHSTTAVGSMAAAGGNISINASGAGEDSNLTIKGSDITAKNNLTLQADNRIDLLAEQSTNEQHSSNSGSSASIGVSIGTSGFMVNASASGSRGKGDGSDVANTNSHVKAGNQLAMTSGGDTIMKGAIAGGKQVIADVGDNLTIESLQDKSHYDSKQQSLGGSVSVGMGKMSGSINAAQSKVNGNYVSVQEQSGIEAGDGGFNVKVNGNTDLKGGQIASTDQAVNDNKNTLTTASLTTGDIQNKSDYKAQSLSISAGGGYGGGQTSLNGTGIGFGNASGSESSVTRSGVSGIAGDTTIRSDKDSSGTLAKNWDGQQLQQDVEAQAKITEAFGKQAALGIGTYATTRLNDLNQQVQAARDGGDNALADKLQGDADNWAEGGAYRTALHAAAGALTGGLAGAAGATASALAMPAIAEQIGKLDVPNAVKQGLSQVAAAALGAAVGGTGGLATAVNTEVNNRQLHQSERDYIKQNAKKFAQLYKEETGQTIDDKRAEQILLGDGYRMVDAAANKGPGVLGPAGDAPAVKFLSQNAEGLFKATSEDYRNPGELSGPLTPEQAALPGAEGNPVLGLATAGLVTGGVALAGVGTSAVIAGAVDAWTAYQAAQAAYSMGTALGTGAIIGGTSYTGAAALSSVLDKNASFGNAFDQRFSYPGLTAAMTVGSLSGMYSTAMFGWAGVSNSIKNLATMPGFIIRINSAVAGQAAGSATQAAVKSSAN